MQQLQDLSATLLFLSSKMEECPQSFDRVVKTWYMIRSGGERVSSQSPVSTRICKIVYKSLQEFQEMKEYFNTMEENLLLTMGAFVLSACVTLMSCTLCSIRLASAYATRVRGEVHVPHVDS